MANNMRKTRLTQQRAESDSSMKEDSAHSGSEEEFMLVGSQFTAAEKSSCSYRK